jgi:hypothetical protein
VFTVVVVDAVACGVKDGGGNLYRRVFGGKCVTGYRIVRHLPKMFTIFRSHTSRLGLAMIAVTGRGVSSLLSKEFLCSSRAES